MVRCALADAASAPSLLISCSASTFRLPFWQVASLMTTTECLVTEIPEEKPAAGNTQFQRFSSSKSSEQCVL